MSYSVTISGYSLGGWRKEGVLCPKFWAFCQAEKAENTDPRTNQQRRRGGGVVVFPRSWWGGWVCGIPVVGGSLNSRGSGGAALPVGMLRPRPPGLAAPLRLC